jgi:hypothetical protein
MKATKESIILMIPKEVSRPNPTYLERTLGSKPMNNFFVGDPKYRTGGIKGKQKKNKAGISSTEEISAKLKTKRQLQAPRQDKTASEASTVQPVPAEPVSQKEAGVSGSHKGVCITHCLMCDEDNKKTLKPT